MVNGDELSEVTTFISSPDLEAICQKGIWIKHGGLFSIVEILLV